MINTFEIQGKSLDVNDEKDEFFFDKIYFISPSKYFFMQLIE